ncbi:serine threonine- kinase Kist [Labeo rohita]|uniref:Serine/threonine-protein kinase Kist n=1 Tax=Labeo rohita TaxID=84645 RepID=A0A498NTS1_LABRO|nr:serine threonine- kinase Kist [Labeo rohita]
MAVTPDAVDQKTSPVVFEIYGKIWNVQARLGQGVSASVYRVNAGRASSAVKEFQVDAQGGDYGYLKESSVLEKIQGHKNIVTLYGMFTNHNPFGVATHCLLLELLDALSFLHREGYVHADLKPRNILWSADDECFKLIDFGLSFKEGHQDVKYIQTDGYRAPEAELQNSLAQAGLESDSGCTAAVDLWSLGIILLEMFSGIKLKETVKSQEWKDNSSAIVDHIFSSNALVYPAIPVFHLRDLIKSMLHNDPKLRSTAEAALINPFFSIPFDIIEDMKEECQKYGTVVSLLIPKENPGKGQVFVEYANAGDSKEAQRLLTGRTFDGKFVVTTFYPLSAYKRDMLKSVVSAILMDFTICTIMSRNMIFTSRAVSFNIRSVQGNVRKDQADLLDVRSVIVGKGHFG